MKFEFSIDIPAPRELVWKIALDPNLRPEWDVRIAKFHVRREPGAGAPITIVFRSFIFRPRAEAVFLRFDPPNQSIIRIGPATPNIVPSGGGTWIFEETETVIRMTTRFNLNTAGVKAPAWLIRALVRSLRRLKRLVLQHQRKSNLAAAAESNATHTK